MSFYSKSNQQKGSSLISVIILSSTLLALLILPQRLVALKASIAVLSKNTALSETKPVIISTPGFALSEEGLLIKNKASPLNPAWGRLTNQLNPIVTRPISTETISKKDLELDLLELSSSRLVVLGDLKANELKLGAPEVEIIALGDIKIEQISGASKQLFLYSLKGKVEISASTQALSLCDTNPSAGELKLSIWAENEVSLLGNMGELNGLFGCPLNLDPNFWPEGFVLGN